MDVQSVTPDMIDRTYSGKAGRCCCGCSGKYFEGGAQIVKVLRTIQAQENIESGCGYFSAVVGRRVYIAYLKAVSR